MTMPEKKTVKANAAVHPNADAIAGQVIESVQAASFTIDQKKLLAILASMNPICTKRTTLEVTTCILFSVGYKELVLKSTDLEISLQTSCEIADSTLSEPRSFLVLGKRIFEVVKELDGMIECTLMTHQLILQSGGVRLALNIKDAAEFPPFPERIENLMHVDAPSFLKMLDGVAFLVPQTNANPALNGLYLEVDATQMILTTTDGHCLAQVRTSKYTLASSKSWLLPRRAIFELKKILETCEDKTLFIGLCGNQLVFSGDVFNFFTKLLADSFPQYKAILDKTDFMPATVDRNQLIKTLRRSSTLLSGQFLATEFTFKPTSVEVFMDNKEVGRLEDEVRIKSEFVEDMSVRFYAPYLLNGLQSLQDEELTFYLKNKTKPIVFESTGEEMSVTYLVMPVAPINAPW